MSKFLFTQILTVSCEVYVRFFKLNMFFMFKHKTRAWKWHIFLFTFSRHFTSLASSKKFTCRSSSLHFLSLLQSPKHFTTRTETSARKWKSALKRSSLFNSLKILPPRHPIAMWSALKKTARSVRLRRLLFIDLQFIFAQLFFTVHTETF